MELEELEEACEGKRALLSGWIRWGPGTDCILAKELGTAESRDDFKVDFRELNSLRKAESSLAVADTWGEDTFAARAARSRTFFRSVWGTAGVWAGKRPMWMRADSFLFKMERTVSHEHCRLHLFQKCSRSFGTSPDTNISSLSEIWRAGSFSFARTVS